MPSQVMFVLNLSFLIGFLFVGTLLLILMIVAWAGVRAGWWHWLARRTAERERRQSRRADGSAYPPTGRGQCQACRSVSREIHYLPNGEKLCRACYDACYPAWRPPPA